MDVAEHRLDGAIAYRALVRYDAYGEMSGRQSTSIALLDAHRSGVVLSSIHHRDQARLYAKQVHNGRGEIELSPEEAEAVRLALAEPPPGRSRPPSARDARRLPRSRGHLLARGARRPARRPTRSSSVSLPTVHDTVMAVHDGRVDRAFVPIENSLEGSVNATLDALALETDGVADRRRARPPRAPVPDRPRGASTLDAIATVLSHPQANAQCARFLRTRLPAGQRGRGQLDRGGGAHGRRARRPHRGARHAPRRRALRLRTSCARASRTRPATRRASSWLAPERPTPGGRRPCEDHRSCSGASGAERPAGWLAA